MVFMGTLCYAGYGTNVYHTRKRPGNKKGIPTSKMPPLTEEILNGVVSSIGFFSNQLVSFLPVQRHHLH